MDRGQALPTPDLLPPSWRTRLVIAALTAAVVFAPALSFIDVVTDSSGELRPPVVAGVVALAAAVLVLTRAHAVGLVVSAATGAAGLPLHGLFATVGVLAWLADDDNGPPGTALLYTALCACAGVLLAMSVAAMPRSRRVPHGITAVFIAFVLVVAWFARASEL